MKHMEILLLVALLSPASEAMGSRSNDVPPPQTVAMVDVERYMGRWYELARFEQSFQKGCVGVTADYTLLEDGRVGVLNTCFDKTLDGTRRVAKGKAYVADTTSNAKLRVSFFWPFYGDYWIFRLEEDYEYAVVGSPDRDALWILSRQPSMDSETYDKLVSEMSREGFDMKRLQKTPQR